MQSFAAERVVITSAIARGNDGVRIVEVDKTLKSYTLSLVDEGTNRKLFKNITIFRKFTSQILSKKRPAKLLSTAYIKTRKTTQTVTLQK